MTQPYKATARILALAAIVVLLQALVADPARADLVINILPGPGLAANQQALDAVHRAAAEWSDAIATDITVNLDVELADYGETLWIARAVPLVLFAPYDVIRDEMAAHANSAPDLAFLSALPTAAQYSASVPTGMEFSGDIFLTQANANALGFGVDYGIDAFIQMNTWHMPFLDDPESAPFDFFAGFQAVAAHEIGHALGFGSFVPGIGLAVHTMGDDLTGHVYTPEPLDLFRFASGDIPETLEEFTNTPRNLMAGSEAVTLVALGEGLRMSQGFYHIDSFSMNEFGWPADHWYADLVNEETPAIGVMGAPIWHLNESQFPITANDLRALQLIGYTLSDPVPEPATLVLIGSSMLIGGLAPRRREG